MFALLFLIVALLPGCTPTIHSVRETYYAKAGYENLTFTYRLNNDNDTARQMASIFQQQLREIGVTMVIQGNEFATFFADAIKGNFQVYSLRWLGANNDPDMFNYVFHSKSIPPAGANRSHYSNPKLDELIEFARREIDIEKRKRAYQDRGRRASLRQRLLYGQRMRPQQPH